MLTSKWIIGNGGRPEIVWRSAITYTKSRDTRGPVDKARMVRMRRAAARLAEARETRN